MNSTPPSVRSYPSVAINVDHVLLGSHCDFIGERITNFEDLNARQSGALANL